MRKIINNMNKSIMKMMKKNRKMKQWKYKVEVLKIQRMKGIMGVIN